MLGETNEGGAPTAEDLQEWQDTYGISHPLVSDSGYAEAFFMNGYLPSMALLGPGAEILGTGNSTGELDIEGALPGSDQEVTTEE